MVWILMTIVFALLFVVAFFGDYEEKERKEDYKLYDDILSRY